MELNEIATVLLMLEGKRLQRIKDPQKMRCFKVKGGARAYCVQKAMDLVDDCWHDPEIYKKLIDDFLEGN